MLVAQTDLTGFASAKGGTNRLLPGLPPSAAWLMETILTFSLIFAIFVATGMCSMIPAQQKATSSLEKPAHSIEL